MGGVFDGESGSEMMPETESRRCKPDYEKLIESQRTKNVCSSLLKNALLNYLDIHGLNSRRSNEFTLSSLLGSLELEIRYGTVNIDKLIKQQEQDKD